MKKLIVLSAIVLSPLLVMAQGTVNFQSTSGSHIITIGGVGVAAGAATVGLYYGTTGSSSNSLVLIQSTTPTINGGAINGGTRTTGSDVAPGGTASFQIRAWTGGFATYELAYAAALSNSAILVGASTIFSNATGDSTAVPPVLPKNLTGWTTAVALAPVPEPSTIALGVLGVGSLLLIRRKK